MQTTINWQAVKPESIYMNNEKLSKLEQTIKSDYHNINGIIIIKDGHLAYEKYFNGKGSDHCHHIASVTKSVLSALIGIAIDKGYINSVEEKVLDFFPEYMFASDQQKQQITIRHLLTMTVPYPFEDWHEPLDKLCQQQDWIKYTLDLMGANGGLGAFKYSTAGAHVLSAILTKSTGKSARAFANEHLFTPLGMKEIPNYEMNAYGFDDLFGKNVKGWVHDPNGLSAGGWGLTLTTRDMARFGYLYINNGMWNNNRVLSETWIRESTEINYHNYGYLWWLRQEDGLFTYSAIGDGGNMICCIPKLNMVVAISSEFIMNPRDRWPLMKEYIISAVINNQ
ncbi:6-aminohexanoate hydrolase [Lysinibacillus sp. KCTC 33748]|uniref:serine hydrolase domain-containing protein n=1 Tax=unclassified Lysinibacillus TaxID=2636778 RepID=UPI0009A8902C|nr:MULTISPECIES: serine hydrolase [unclassified Lysinibacillus]OXS76152.1 6-aminohexanoate hydrolase [Lysinibacillus sp. KCTC 33748]SKB41354.1 CubicO group peptidase, beta-lactamase class C family [Lysinibacillus sp. AC-3]